MRIRPLCQLPKQPGPPRFLLAQYLPEAHRRSRCPGRHQATRLHDWHFISSGHATLLDGLRPALAHASLLDYLQTRHAHSGGPWPAGRGHRYSWRQRHGGSLNASSPNKNQGTSSMGPALARGQSGRRQARSCGSPRGSVCPLCGHPYGLVRKRMYYVIFQAKLRSGPASTTTSRRY